jgi:catechol 2,3-dioxygenase-like lactoylglutathione lyase family enzyme
VCRKLFKIKQREEKIMSGINKVVKGCGFHHVSMKVRDLDKSIKFYTEGLGFVERFSWGQAPQRTVLLDTGDGNYFEISQGNPEQVIEEGFFRHIALRTDDCEAALEAARAAGADITVETRDVTISTEPPLQLRIAFFKGPDGEVIELFQDNQT